MMNALRLAWRSITLYSRIRGYIFFLFLLPMILFGLYMSIFANGDPVRVTAFLGPVLALTATSQGLHGVAGEIVRSREWRMLIPYQLAGVQPWQIVVAQLVVAVLIVTGVGVTQIAVAVFIYGVKLPTSVPVLLAVLCLGSIALGGVGLMFASIVNTPHESDMLLQLAFLCFVIVSGMTVPFAMLPGYVQSIAAFLPTTILVLLFQALIVDGESIAAHWQQIAILLLFFIATVGLAINLFRWDNSQKATSRARLLAALSLVPLLIGGMFLNGR
jgi:ABC-2 type transport system permease protein